MTTATEITLTEDSKALFLAYAKEAKNWNGEPHTGTVVLNGEKEDRGNLTHCKKAGLLTTFRDEGVIWIAFTDKGREYAASHGIDLSWI